MGVQNLTIASPPDGVTEMSTDRLRPQSLARWENNGAGGTTTYRVLHEWDTDSGFGTPITVLNTGIANTVFEDIGIPPSDMGPTGTTWYYQFTVTDDDDAGSLTSASLYDATFLDPKLAKRHLFAPISIQPDFTARRIEFQGTVSVNVTGQDENILSSDEAHIHQGIKNWQDHNATDVTGTPQIPPQAPPPFGTLTSTFALECITNIDDVLPGVKSGAVASTDGFPLTPSTQYSHSVMCYTELVAKEFRITLIDYDGGDVEGDSQIGAWTSVPQNSYVEVSVTGTTAADAANGLLRVEMRNADLTAVPSGSTWYQAAHCVRLGADATFMPSCRIDGDIDMRAKFRIDPAAVGENHLLAMRSGNSGFIIGVDAGNSNRLFARHGDGTTDRLGVDNTGTTPFGTIRVAQAVFIQSAGTWDFYLDGTLTEQDTGLATGPASPYASPIYVGTDIAGGGAMNGEVFYVEVRDGKDGPITARLSGSAYPNGTIVTTTTWTNVTTTRIWTANGSDMVSQGGLDEPALSKRHLYAPLNLGPGFYFGGPDDRRESKRHLYAPINVTTDVPIPFIFYIQPVIVDELDSLLVIGQGFDDAGRNWNGEVRLYDNPDPNDPNATYVVMTETSFTAGSLQDEFVVTVGAGSSSGWVVVWNDGTP